MKRIAHGILMATLMLVAGTTTLHGEERLTLTSSQTAPGEIGVSVRHEIDAAIGRGLDWLAAQQKPNGAWSNEKFPALTALSLQAFLGRHQAGRQAVVDRATAFILSCVRDDGGIYCDVVGQKGGGLSNYNTAICMAALHKTGRPEVTRVIQNARTFVANAQHFGGDVYTGGFGYDRETQRPYADLLNTYYAVGAMRETQDVEDRRPAGEKKADLDWQQAQAFIAKLQSPAESGADNAGGFIYNPTDPKAGTLTNEAGIVYFRSYGSITYAGLLALMYAELKTNDPRVVSALDWSARHWSLDENPGMGQEGLFFFYHVLTRALTTAHRELIPLSDGTVLNWREELAKKLISLQKIDPATGQGYWINDTGRFWEADPVLATAYSLTALDLL